MSRATDRPGTVLLVIDAQNGVLANADQRDHVVANIATLVERARGEAVPVVWVQHSSDALPMDTAVWQIVPELEPASSEAVICKEYGDSFEATDLEQVLEEAGIGHLVVVGAQTDACVRSTLHGGFTRGYDATLVSDAHTTEDLTEWGAPPPAEVIAHTNLYWSFQTAPGRTGKVVTTADVEFTRKPSSPAS
ncbi:nicotinamidase-related amidase [Cryobacterium sp. CAN_C3]|uniref:isochorismatase family protein n=1 Tax=unclassified Cryobacterium TaxID=2649013 RepID=UPI0018C9720B|nr:isochorismatase family protein [Cryobacterium sp. CAN_C3]MEC5152765.1 nicotinamidase-related amidase [Cryobacterium sp. CAN_C3]